MKYLTVEIFVQDEKNGRLFGELGFSREMSRIIKKVEPHEISPPSPDPFRVRKGDNDDAFFIMWLNSQSASFTIPPGRDIPKDEILLRYLATYTELPLDDNSYFEALIIEDRALMKPIGYLLLKLHYEDSLTGEQLAYIYDLAIHSDYWGKRATQRLMREAENRLAARGIAYWLGDISIENPRALKTAMKSLRFQLESERWLKKLPKL
jgi:ribosomal protein S18 acetylase RimI-like enzyme